MAWAVSVNPSDKYYATWHDAMVDQYGSKYYKGGKRQKRAESAAREAWEKDRELQETEFNALKSGQTKTVDYGSAASDGEMTTEEERLRAELALEEEEQLLGMRLGMLGKSSLSGVG